MEENKKSGTRWEKNVPFALTKSINKGFSIYFMPISQFKRLYSLKWIEKKFLREMKMKRKGDKWFVKENVGVIRKFSDNKYGNFC